VGKFEKEFFCAPDPARLNLGGQVQSFKLLLQRLPTRHPNIVSVALGGEIRRAYIRCILRRSRTTEKGVHYGTEYR
jgi:hypothetical protein